MAKATKYGAFGLDTERVAEKFSAALSRRTETSLSDDEKALQADLFISLTAIDNVSALTRSLSREFTETDFDALDPDSEMEILNLRDAAVAHYAAQRPNIGTAYVWARPWSQAGFSGAALADKFLNGVIDVETTAVRASIDDSAGFLSLDRVLRGIDRFVLGMAKAKRWTGEYSDSGTKVYVRRFTDENVKAVRKYHRTAFCDAVIANKGYDVGHFLAFVELETGVSIIAVASKKTGFVAIRYPRVGTSEDTPIGRLGGAIAAAGGTLSPMLTPGQYIARGISADAAVAIGGNVKGIDIGEARMFEDGEYAIFSVESSNHASNDPRLVKTATAEIVN